MQLIFIYYFNIFCTHPEVFLNVSRSRRMLNETSHAGRGFTATRFGRRAVTADTTPDKLDTASDKKHITIICQI